MRSILLIALLVLGCYAAAVDEDASSKESGEWKEKAKDVYDKTVTGAKAVGGAVAEHTVAGYDATVNYFSNRTVSGVAEDIGKGAKAVGSGIADGAKKAWGGITGFFKTKPEEQ